MTTANIPTESSQAPNAQPGSGLTVSVNQTDSLAHRAANTVNLSDAAPSRPGILSTARRAGMPIMSGPLKDGDVVRVTLPSGAATQMTLRQARHAGIVREDAADGYVLNAADTPSEQRKAAPEGSPEATREVPEAAPSIPMDPNVAQLADSMRTTIKAQGRNDLNLVAEFLATGAPPKALAEIARDAGISHEQAIADFNAVAREHSIQAMAAVMVEGVPQGELDNFFAYVARTNPPGKVKSAMMRQYIGGDLRPFQQWARDYLRSAPRGSTKTVTALVGGRQVKTTEGAARRLGGQIISQ